MSSFKPRGIELDFFEDEARIIVSEATRLEKIIREGLELEGIGKPRYNLEEARDLVQRYLEAIASERNK
jgi:hypothetical protein